MTTQDVNQILAIKKANYNYAFKNMSQEEKYIAMLIHSSPELRGNVNVGMYVGGQSGHDSKVMQPDKVISDHETLLQNIQSIV